MMESLGEKIVSSIIDGKLVRAECAEDRGHSCVLVWSANVHEQIDEMVGGHIASTVDCEPVAGHVRAVMSELLKEHFGERCPDVSWGCPVCDRWGWLDKLLANPYEDEE